MVLRTVKAISVFATRRSAEDDPDWQMGIDYDRLYEYRFQDIDHDAREGVWREIAAFIHARLDSPKRVLDPAAGTCEFINAVPSPERWAVDRVDYGARRGDVRFVVSDIFAADLPEAHFDGTFVSNFLEHLPSPDAIADFLALLHGWMAPGGRIAIMGPNYRYCSKMYWDCADHELALTHVAIEEHLYSAGFELVRTEPRFLPFSFRGALPASARLTRAYLSAPAAWRVLGKQFLVVARRPR